jgi:hypothetical protein
MGINHFFSPTEKAELIEMLKSQTPQAVDLPGHRWTLKKLLAKAKPEARQQYIEQLSQLFVQLCDGQAILV